MSTVLRVLLGAALVFVTTCVGVYTIGLVAVLPLPHWYWGGKLVGIPFDLYSLIVFVPFVVVVAVLLRRLFPVRPVLGTVLSVLLFTLQQVGDIVVQLPHSFLSTLRGAASLFTLILIGTPATVYLLGRLRSNQRLERP